MTTTTRVIGQSVVRGEGPDKVTGRSIYAADISLPGMLWGKVLRSPFPPRPHRQHRYCSGQGRARSARGDHRRRLARLPGWAPAAGHAGAGPRRGALRRRKGGGGCRRDRGGRRGGAAAHRRGVRGTGRRFRCPRGYGAGRADAASGVVGLRGTAAAGVGHQQRVRPHHLGPGRRGPGIRRGRPGVRAHVQRPADAPGLHRTACLRGKHGGVGASTGVGQQQGPLPPSGTAGSRMGHR